MFSGSKHSKALKRIELKCNNNQQQQFCLVNKKNSNVSFEIAVKRKGEFNLPNCAQFLLPGFLAYFFYSFSTSA